MAGRRPSRFLAATNSSVEPLAEMEVAMQRVPSTATAGPAFSAAGAPPRLRDPAEIFRRLDRRPRSRPLWVSAVAVAVLGLAAATGVILFPNDFGSIASHMQILAARLAGS